MKSDGINIVFKSSVQGSVQDIKTLEQACLAWEI